VKFLRDASGQTNRHTHRNIKLIFCGRNDYLDDFDGGKFETAIEFSGDGRFKDGSKPLKDFIVRAEFDVVGFCDEVALYHQRQSSQHL